jgi:hypothetical protein
MISRAMVITFRMKIDDGSDFANYKGWVVYNEVVGLMSIHSTNLMYIFNSCTVILASKNLDHNWQEENELKFKTNKESANQKKHSNHMSFRRVVLFWIVPLFLLLAILGELAFKHWSCLCGRIITEMCNLLTWALTIWAYSSICRVMRVR